MKKIIYTALLLLVTVSCDKWFEAEPQGGGQSGAKVFDNEGSFRDYMNGIYTGLRSAELYGSNLTLGGMEFLAQSFNPYAGAEAWAKMGFNDDMALTIAREAYTKLYAAIYQCNDILRLFAEKKDVDFIAGSREMMVAEARGLRAFLHFELLRLYSPACTVDSGASNILWIEGTQPKGVQMTTAQLTDKIISELEAAAAELAKYDPIVTGVGYDDLSLLGTTPIDRVWKLNYYGCLAAEARALMSRGTAEDFGKAYGLLTKIIGEGGYAFVRTVSGTDYEFSAEFIFALPSPETGFCALSEELFNPAPDGKGVTLSARLDIDELHADDRRRNWFDSDNTMRTKFAPTSKIDKWKTAPAIPVIKIGEVYLMAAEAAAKSNQLPAGIGQFNDFMVQRNSESLKLPDTATQAQLMEALGKQYQYEFLGEGVRYHFCKRLNLTVTAYDGSQITDVGKKAFPIVK